MLRDPSERVRRRARALRRQPPLILLYRAPGGRYASRLVVVAPLPPCRWVGALHHLAALIKVGLRLVLGGGRVRHTPGIREAHGIRE